MKILMICPESIYNVIINTKYIYKNIDFQQYNNLYDIDYSKLNKYNYVIVCNQLFYVNENKLKEFLEKQKPNYCSIKSYWGIGSPAISIINSKILKNYKNINKQTTFNLPDNNECWIYQLAGHLLKLNHNIQIFSIKPDILSKLYSKYKIYNISNQVYTKNNNIKTDGQYHNSIFVNYTNDPKIFLDCLKTFKTKIKEVFYNKIIHKTIVGTNYFLIHNKEIALLGKDLFIYWSQKNQMWKPIESKKYKNEIIEYVDKHTPSSTLKLLDLQG